jgi:23S rRNA (pseudouridine1915-N3)-methyltransferase
MRWSGCGAPSWTRSRRLLAEQRSDARLLIIAVGRIGHGPEAELAARYARRIRPPLAVTEVAEGRGSAAEIRRREAAALLAALPPKAFAVALDQGGEAPDSEIFSVMLARWLEAGRPVAFLIGGAEGLDGSVLERADAALSLGRLTWPHLLARAMLAEQIYRALSLAAGHPYHRGGRPRTA